ncbi:MAG: DUF554 domain-containing protein [Anaerolineae bacterium]|jgi:uncharacterized membrane protein YqgA involved in biofilm formation|nr:DUF554 domain-containing protein [Anaerolineae bacterium]
MPVGTLINVATVLLGSTLGLLLRRRFPQAIQTIIFQSVGLATLVLGVQMALEGENFLVLIFSLIIGGIVGELLHLDVWVESLATMLKDKIHIGEATFVEGLITAFLLFCVGSMTIVGALNEGLSADRTLLLTKSLLDGFTSIALASVYGVGVLFAVVPLFLVQGGLTLLAGQFQGLFSPLLINGLTAVGGVLILGIGLTLLELKAIKTTNLLPSLAVVVILTLLTA